MESSSLNLNNLTFTTWKNNRVETPGYFDIFSKRRVVVVCLTNLAGSTSTIQQLVEFTNSYEQIKQLGIDEVYCLSSMDFTIAPWANRQSTKITGLADKSKEFLKLVATHCNQTVDLPTLAQYWQYIAVIDDGKIEKVLYNHIKQDLKLKVLKNDKYQYHGLGVDSVTKYLSHTKPL
jgi:peroxiredoxin